MEDKKLLQNTRNLFVKLKIDPASVLFAEELLDKRLLKKLKKSKYERDSELLKLIDSADNKDFLDDNKVPTGADYVEKRETDRSTLYSFDGPFSETCFKNIGLTVRGFDFFYPYLSTSLKNFFQPSQNLLNIESGTEEASTIPTQYSFCPVQQQIEEKIKEYNAVPSKNFINKSYFLYDTSGLIKESYITAINKKSFLVWVHQLF